MVTPSAATACAGRFQREPHWYCLNPLPASVVPRQWRNWLQDSGSLTARLIAASEGEFRVRVLSQQLARPRLSEASALGIDADKLALVREVILYGCEVPWVYARSIMPLSTLTGRLRRLRKLDNRPLGALLFSDPSMQRKPMEVARLNAHQRYLPSELEIYDSPMWGRRSVFLLDRKPLLVSEIFLPSFRPYNRLLSPHFHPY